MSSTIDGVIFGFRVPIAEDLDAHQAHHPRHPIAILIEVAERRIAVLGQVHLDASNQLLEELLRDGEAPHALRQSDTDWMAGLAFITAVKLAPPFVEAPSLLRARCLAIGDVIHRTTERVDGIHRLALFLRKEQE